MKIAQINFCDRGSTGKISRDIFSVLNDDNNKIYVCSKITNQPNVVEFTNNIEHQIHRILGGVFDLDSLGSYFSTKKLVKQLKKDNIDILHLQNIHGYFINYKVLFNYIKKNNVKTIWTLHDCWSFTGHCPYFDMVKCEKWKTQCHHCSNIHTYPRSLFFDRSKSFYKFKKKTFNGVKDLTLVTPSKWLAGLVKQSFLQSYPVKVINNGINLENFNPIDKHTFDKVIDRNKKIILAVSNYWAKRKGYPDLFELNKHIDKNEYEFVVVGVDKIQSNELKNEGIIPIMRTENQKQLAELYSMASVFINLTYEDNFPTVNIEALSCGCPIVTYNTGGSIEVITDETGLVVAQGNVAEMAEGILKIVNRDYNRENICKEAQKNFNAEVMANKYKQLYLSTL
ncbi:MAG: glycosyltransferase [Clostridia bacterium]